MSAVQPISLTRTFIPLNLDSSTPASGSDRRSTIEHFTKYGLPTGQRVTDEEAAGRGFPIDKLNARPVITPGAPSYVSDPEQPDYRMEIPEGCTAVAAASSPASTHCMVGIFSDSAAAREYREVVQRYIQMGCQEQMPDKAIRPYLLKFGGPGLLNIGVDTFGPSLWKLDNLCLGLPPFGVPVSPENLRELGLVVDQGAQERYKNARTDLAMKIIKIEADNQRPENTQNQSDTTQLRGLLTGLDGVMIERLKNMFSETGEPMHAINRPVFSPDGKLTAVQGLTGNLIIYDLAADSAKFIANDHARSAYKNWRDGIAFSPDSEHIVLPVASDKKLAVVCRLNASGCAAEDVYALPIPEVFQEKIAGDESAGFGYTKVAYSPDESIILVGARFEEKNPSSIKSYLSPVEKMYSNFVAMYDVAPESIENGKAKLLGYQLEAGSKDESASGIWFSADGQTFLATFDQAEHPGEMVPGDAQTMNAMKDQGTRLFFNT
ncbi:hypothetical protein ACVBEF_20505 [Glaciimonas sp. GG7]